MYAQIDYATLYVSTDDKHEIQFWPTEKMSREHSKSKVFKNPIIVSETVETERNILSQGDIVEIKIRGKHPKGYIFTVEITIYDLTANDGYFVSNAPGYNNIDFLKPEFMEFGMFVQKFVFFCFFGEP